MTANVVHPAELERMLQARVAAARAKRVTARRTPSATSRRRFSRGPAAMVAASLLALSAASVWASHGDQFIDLTANGADETHNGAIFTQGGVGAGTGNFDPFLTLQPGGNVDFEQGYNMCDEPVFGFDDDPLTPAPDVDCPGNQFDESEGGDKTHELLASSIPAVEVGGAVYREFFLDSNDPGADPWMSIQIIKLLLDDQPDLTDYDPGTESFDNDNDAPTATVAWDMDDTGDATILMNTQGLESGSGVSDISVLVPNSVFPADCNYGSIECDTFVYFYTEAGDPNLEIGGVHEGKNWNTSAGFEEWRIELLPVVNVDKDVTVAFDRTHAWEIEKAADVESIDLFAGDTADIEWTVKVSADGQPVDSNITVSGDIVIQNPTGPNFAIEDPIPAVVTDVADVLTLGGVQHDADDVTCPSAFPFTIAAGASVTCSYTFSPTETDNGTNTATVTILTAEGEDGAPDEFAEYTDTESVDFGDASIDEIDECITVTDDNATAGLGDDFVFDPDPVCVDDLVGGEFTFDPFTTQVGPFTVATCGSTSVTNTATFETNDTDTTDSADDTVAVECYELTVAKTVDTSLTRTWEWDLEKVADVGTIDLFAGDTASIEWTVKLIGLGSTDSAFHVEGDITVTNPAPIVADDVDVSDAISGFAGTITIDCGGGLSTVDIPANDSATCSYEADLPDGTARTNTATATLFGIDYDSDAEDVDFTGATVTDIDECITVTDDNATPGDDTDDFTFSPNPVCVDDLVNDEFEFDPFSTDVGPFTVDNCASIEITNTTSSLTNDEDVADSADDTVDVNCYELTVSKDATTTFSRDYDWDVQKTRFIADGEDDGDGNPLTLTLDEGQVYTANYEITVTMTGSTDDDHAVSGTITISNPAPMIADDVAVTDVISHAVDADIDATVDCGGGLTTVDVPAAAAGVPGTATCSYSADLDDSDDRLNTATATLFGIGYDGTANVTFDLENPTTEIDECIDITDDAGTPGDASDDIDLGTVCVGDLDANDQYTDEYTMDIGPFAVCGPATFVNTVSWVTTNDDNDTDESGSDTYTVNVDVPCPQGCTLTQGYWKTHNDSFWGGAPSDETWFLLGDVDLDGFSEGELEIFFGNDELTYFDAMWTAPGGNAYYQLSRQYIAAILNQLDGAAVPANVQAAIDAAEELFMEYTPAEVAAAKGKGGKELRSQFTSLAGLLASYNEGLIGPGHCDEDSTSSASSSGTQLIADRRTFVTIG